jgi:regulator of nonsense transcripts 1
MDSFENFQYDSASSYGGMGSVVDDTSSVYTATTNSRIDLDLEALSLSDSRSALGGAAGDAHTHNHVHSHVAPAVEEDVDAVLDDLKDGGQLDLPPHACR